MSLLSLESKRPLLSTHDQSRSYTAAIVIRGENIQRIRPGLCSQYCWSAMIFFNASRFEQSNNTRSVHVQYALTMHRSSHPLAVSGCRPVDQLFCSRVISKQWRSHLPSPFWDIWPRGAAAARQCALEQYHGQPARKIMRRMHTSRELFNKRLIQVRVIVEGCAAGRMFGIQRTSASDCARAASLLRQFLHPQ